MLVRGILVAIALIGIGFSGIGLYGVAAQTMDASEGMRAIITGVMMLAAIGVFAAMLPPLPKKCKCSQKKEGG